MALILNEMNLEVFCSKFKNDQRNKVMVLAGPVDKDGNFTMKPDEAVKQVVKNG